MKRVVGIVILAFISITTLSSCLVEKKDPSQLVQIARTTDNLRVYQPGHYIDYDVTATTIPLISPPTTQTGTLRVQWFANANLIRPNEPSSSIPVLKEVTTLSLDGGASDPGTIRYISQDANGQVTLHVLEEEGLPPYWLSTEGETDKTITASSIVFYSPIVPGIKPQTDFFVMDNCEGNATCTSAIGRYIDDQEVVGDSVAVTTKLGVFLNPFQINFFGSATPSPAPFQVFFDVRNVCGTNTTQHGFAGNGKMYVMPEIGMIRMENSCYIPLTQDLVIYTITIRSTNISLS